MNNLPIEPKPRIDIRVYRAKTGKWETWPPKNPLKRLWLKTREWIREGRRK